MVFDHTHTPEERKAIIKALEKILTPTKGKRVNISPIFGENFKDLMVEENEN